LEVKILSVNAMAFARILGARRSIAAAIFIASPRSVHESFMRIVAAAFARAARVFAGGDERSFIRAVPSM
jgi:hypothetical protein